ncbi:MAG: redox-sensing transcriptional repressor Rex [Phycisphaerae bacterium]|nr:redox-sensing transcriptional repressor Rex [Phycisphaerae bacterium]
MNNQKTNKAVSRATLERLPKYYAFLAGLLAKGREVVSGTKISQRFGFDPTQVRKDIEAAGGQGRPRIGFEIRPTMLAIETFLGWNNTNDAVLVGAGYLGAALLGYEGFAGKGLNILAAFDKDPARQKQINGKTIFDMDRFEDLVKRLGVKIGVICVPAKDAQSIAELMIQAKIKAIWNLTPTHLNVPEDIIVEDADLSSSLSILSGRLAAKNK